MKARTLPIRTPLVILAWGLAAAVAFVTLGPLADRPQFGHPQAERFAAYLVLGLCWSSAYPARRGWIAAGLVAAALVLEAAQGLVPGRDPRLADALIKACGALCGVGTAMAWAGRPRGRGRGRA